MHNMQKNSIIPENIKSSVVNIKNLNNRPTEPWQSTCKVICKKNQKQKGWIGWLPDINFTL